MQEKFITYDLALELKGLGYDEPCFAVYGYTPENNTLSPKDKLFLWHEVVHFEGFIAELKNSIVGGDVTAPTWQDAFDWFDKTYGLFSCFFKANTLLAKENYYVFYITDKNNVEIEDLEERYDVILDKAHQDIEGNYVNDELHYKLIFEEKYGFKTISEARAACLQKLIELVKSK